MCFGPLTVEQQQIATMHSCRPGGAPPPPLQGTVEQRLLPVLLRLERQRARSLAGVLAAAPTGQGSGVAVQQQMMSRQGKLCLLLCQHAKLTL